MGSNPMLGIWRRSRLPSVSRWTVAAFALLSAYAASIFLPHRSPAVEWVHELVPVLVPLTVAVLCAVAARALPTSRTKWVFLALGAAAWAAGDLAFTVLDTLKIEPAASLTFADAGYLALVPLWCAALITHPARAGRGLEQWGTSLDSAAAIVGAGGLVWVYVFIPVARTATDIPGVIVNLAYPLGDLALLVAFLALLPRTGIPPRRHDSFLGAGFVLLAVADLIFARLAITNSYVTGSPLDLVFIGGFVCVGFAARAEIAAPADAKRPARSSGPLVGVIAVGLLSIVGIIGIATDHRMILSAGVLMGILIASRQTLLFHDRRLLNAALEVAMESAQSANQAKTVFLSHMSHELGTPLTSILGYAQLIEGGVNESESREYAGKIAAAGKHLDDIVAEALDISRIEQGRLALSLEPVGVAGIAVECLAIIRPFADRSGIHVHVASEEGQRFVLADRRRLKQAVLNFVSNAVKYSSEHDTVTVAWRTVERGRMRIEVDDTGPGIDATALERLFTPFERLGSVRKTSGTGLGLALTKRMVEAMGGTVGVDSTVGRGSTFWIELPETAPPRAPRVFVPIQGGRTTGTVLYIEDNEANVAVITQILRTREVEVVGAAEGVLGVEQAVQEPPDLILLDQHLPDIEATDVLARLRAAAPTRDVPVVILSADASPEGFEELMAAGARAYLTKPVDVDRLTALVDEVLATRRDPRAEPLPAPRVRTA